MKYTELVELFKTSDVLTVDASSINTPYKRKQALLRCLAVEWQYESMDEDFDWYDLIDCQDFFKEYGKKYGLLMEFRENGII